MMKMMLGRIGCLAMLLLAEQTRSVMAAISRGIRRMVFLHQDSELQAPAWS